MDRFSQPRSFRFGSVKAAGTVRNRPPAYLGVEREQFQALAHAPLRTREELVERRPVWRRQVRLAHFPKPDMDQMHDVQETLVHTDADQEVVVNRLTLVAPFGDIVEPNEAAVQPLDGRVRPVDRGPQRRDCGAELRDRPARRRDRGVRALDRADKIARQGEGAVELDAVNRTVRRVEDVVQLGPEVFRRQIGDVHARAVKVLVQVFVAYQERHSEVSGDPAIAFLGNKASAHPVAIVCRAARARTHEQSRSDRSFDGPDFLQRQVGMLHVAEDTHRRPQEEARSLWFRFGDCASSRRMISPSRVSQSREFQKQGGWGKRLYARMSICTKATRVCAFLAEGTCRMSMLEQRSVARLTIARHAFSRRTPAERTSSGEPSPFSTSGPAMPSRAE